MTPTVAGWICLGLPLAGAGAITGLGTRIGRRGAGYLATASVAGAFAALVLGLTS
jgi:hypothetical protein